MNSLVTFTATHFFIFWEEEQVNLHSDYRVASAPCLPHEYPMRYTPA